MFHSIVFFNVFFSVKLGFFYLKQVGDRIVNFICCSAGEEDVFLKYFDKGKLRSYINSKIKFLILFGLRRL